MYFGNFMENKVEAEEFFLKDVRRCARKYGKDWEEYCEKVPYVFIPGIY